MKRLLNHLYDIVEDQQFEANIRNSKLAPESRSKRVILKGYFQDMSYYNTCESKTHRPRLVDPSAWFQAQCEFLARHPTVTMHVRLGDFKQNLNTIGVLNSTYYLDGLEKLSVEDQDEIWVFSDDIEEAKSICKKLTGFQFKYMEIPENADPAESLILMSMGKKILTSNSTFSIWAGIFSDSTSKVAHPASITRSSPYNVRNLPKNWIAIAPVWYEDD